jgi:hypothetical protein
VDNALHFRSSFIEPRVNEDLLRRFQTIIARHFFPREIDGDDIARGYEAQTRLLGSSSFDENFIVTWDPRAHVAAGLLGQIQLTQHPAGTGYLVSQLRKIAHGISTSQLKLEE